MNNSLDTSKNVIDHFGQLTQMLHNCLTELGHDQRLQQTGIEISGSKEGLAYVVSKTTQAAECSLQAIENAQPVLKNLAINAAHLHGLWQQLPEATAAAIGSHPSLDNALRQTLDFLDEIPKQTNIAQASLTEIMMAQNFHDLTGQVIQKIARVIETAEQEIQQLLANENLGKKETVTKQKNSLLNGPVTSPQKQDGVYVDQNQVDDLLTKLGL